jgi:sugar/nucleoside kinase (ribokinase family)
MENSMKYDITCVGLTILDILGKGMEQIPEGAKTTLIEKIRITPAGTAAGPAVIAAKLGLKTALIGAIGNDDLGNILEQMLQKQGVDTAYLQKTPNRPTAATILAVNKEGARPNFHAIGATILLEIDDVRRRCITESRFVHWGGVGTMPNLDNGRGAEILKEAKNGGAVITGDFISPTPKTLAQLKRVLPYIDYFMPSFEEAREVASTNSPEETAKYFMDLGAGACILKMGAKGSLLVTEEKQITIPAFAVNAYDTTGCGDAYCAGFIAALAKGRDLETSCRFASATAALVATGLGSDAGVIDFAETEKAMITLSTL